MHSDTSLLMTATVTAQACKNLNKWGRQSLETLGLAVAEESGELAEAILQNKWENGERKRIREEAVDLAALCWQIAEVLDHPSCAACDRGDYQAGHSEYCPKNEKEPGQ